jgi:hypothetical protein
MTSKILIDSTGTPNLIRPLKPLTPPTYQRCFDDKTPRSKSLEPVRDIVEDYLDLLSAIKKHWPSHLPYPDDIRVHLIGADIRLGLLRGSGIARAGALLDE